MKQLWLAILGVICLHVSVNAQEFDFRKARWGMNMAEVKASEASAPAYEKDGSIAYNVTVLTREMFALYLFIEDKFVQGAYTLTGAHQNPNEYIQDFDDFKRALTKKYGKPVQDDALWNHYKDQEEYERGWAVGVGRLQLQAAWETDTTIIYCILSGSNNTSELNLFYKTKDPKLQALILAEQEKKAKESAKTQTEKKDAPKKDQEKESQDSGL